jgi:Spy/CpxP family protein refolding chaperone
MQMERIIKNRWSVRLGVIAIFLLGFLAGALTINLYQNNFSTAASRGRRYRFDRIITQLDLSQEQKTKVEKILSDARVQLRELRKETQPRMSQVREQIHEQIKEVLTPEQWQKFQQIMEERRKQHRRWGHSDEDEPHSNDQMQK